MKKRLELLSDYAFYGLLFIIVYILGVVSRILFITQRIKRAIKESKRRSHS